MDNGKELQIAQRRSNDFREEVNKFCREIHRRKNEYDFTGIM